MKIRTLQNKTRLINAKTIFRGREYSFPPKHAKSFNMEDEEESALFFHWKNIYGFLWEIKVGDKNEEINTKK